MCVRACVWGPLTLRYSCIAVFTSQLVEFFGDATSKGLSFVGKLNLYRSSSL